MSVSWALVIAVFLSASVVGRIADMVLSRIYNERLKASLERVGTRFDKISTRQLLHQGIERGASLVTLFFESRIVGRRLVGLSLMASIAVWAWWLTAFNTRASRLGVGFLLCCGTLLAAHFALAVVRTVRLVTQPTILRLSMIGIGEVIVIGWIVPLIVVMPLAILVLWNSTTFWKLWATSWYLLVTEPSVLSLFFPLLAIAGGFPILLHVAMVARDVSRRIVVQPIAKLAALLLREVAQEKRPMTWFLTIAGAIPGLVKAWYEVIAA